MLDIFTVSFFGHRNFSEHFQIEPKLENLLKDIITEHEFVEFLVGRNGEFDQFVCSTIRKIKKDFCASKTELVCVLPYETAEYKNNEKSFCAYYDRVEIYTPSQRTHFKALIKNRNQEMILRSNLVISYVNRKTSGAYICNLFAQNNHISVINLAEQNT